MDRFHQLMDLLDKPAFFVDEAGKIVAVNSAASALLQISETTLLDRSLQQLCQKQHTRSPLPEDLNAYWQEPHNIDSEGHWVTPSGDLRLLQWQIRPVAEDSERGLLLTANDITDTIRLRQKERHYHSQLATLLHNLPGYVYWKDASLVYRGCNQNYVHALGFSTHKDIVGKTDDELLDDLALVAVLGEKDREILNNPEAKLEQEEQRCIEGQELATVICNRVATTDSQGKVNGLIGTYQDISARKQQEAELTEAKTGAEIENQAKSTFLANMSHDLKTPLHSVIGLAEMLQMRQHGIEQKEYIEGILAGANTILRLVEDILSFSKLESGKFKLSSESFDLRELIEGIIGAISHQANSKNVKLIVSYCESVPHRVRSDPHAIRRIIINLLNNAIKFTQHGHVMISVETIAIQGQKADLQIIVEDTGIGIGKEHVEHIFDRFYRADPSYNGQYHGSGLGLTIAKQLADDLGGMLKVNSRIGSGSTFWCSLPFQIEEGSVERSIWQQKHAEARILLVDDHDIRGYALKKQIGSSRTQVVSSKEVLPEMIRAAQSGQPYDIAIIDDEILNSEVCELAGTIKQQKNLPQPMLIACIKPSSLAINDRLISAGFMARLVKPVQPTEFMRELTQQWEQWLVRREKQKIAEEPNARVLLVEDNFFSQKVSRVMLEGLGCQLDVAGNGERAIELASKYYDIIFMDLGLPDIDGIEVTRRIRESRQGNPNVFICALTAHASDRDKQRCLDAGMNDFMSKPARMEDFERMLALAKQAGQQHLLNSA